MLILLHHFLKQVVGKCNFVSTRIEILIIAGPEMIAELPSKGVSLPGSLGID
jgi:hypothetical protein